MTLTSARARPEAHPRASRASTSEVPQHGAFQDRVQITTVTHLTEDGVDRRFIQAQVGHESDSSTAVYTHVSDDFMNTALRRALALALDTDHESRPGPKERR